jgi:two-component system NtrC family response regulator
MSEEKRKLLIVEDDPGLQRQLRWNFSDYEVLIAGDRATALDLVREENPPVATVDLGLPPDEDGAAEGLATLSEILAEAPSTKVIMVTGNEDRANALQAVASGAYDFYQKPINSDTLELIVQRAFHLWDLEDENRRLAGANRQSPLAGIVTASPEMLKVCRMVERVASSDVSVLILGESGTGKEVLAQGLHKLSARADGKFVAINCAAIPENLLESELFGHEKGAFTGAVKQTPGKIELADGGTLFLDEIGDLAPTLQVKLLRFLQERVVERVGGRKEIAVDVRIVCATHQNLEEGIKDGRFREDLFYRLSELVVHIPPLRERPGDATLLAKHFLDRVNMDQGRSLRGFTEDALAAVEAYNWPGNVRELENRVKRATVMAEGNRISAADLDLAASDQDAEPLNLKKVREVAERQALQRAMAQADGNISQAAKLLGVSRPTLYDLMRQHNLKA